MAGALMKVKFTQSCPTLCDPTVCPWNSPGQNTGTGCHSLLQGIFLTQGSNWSLPADSLPSELPGKPGKYPWQVPRCSRDVPTLALLPWMPPSLRFSFSLPLFQFLLFCPLASALFHLTFFTRYWIGHRIRLGFSVSSYGKTRMNFFGATQYFLIFFNLSPNRVLDFLIVKECSGLPCWLSAEESACQCRRHRFSSSFGKIPTCHRAAKPKHHNYWACALEPGSLDPVLHKRNHHDEKPAHRPCSPQLEKEVRHQWRPHTAKNKFLKITKSVHHSRPFSSYCLSYLILIPTPILFPALYSTQVVLTKIPIEAESMAWL